MAALIAWLAGLIDRIHAPALKLAEVCDAWRMFPRAVLFSYGVLCTKVFVWYTALPAPTSEQTAFAGIVMGLVAPLTAFYLQTGRKWSP